MARKIFVSYKHKDNSVAPLEIAFNNHEITQGRHYVSLLEELLREKDHIYKGEKDEEPLSGFKDETIESKLRNKIFDSTITIVLISKGMKDPYLDEKDQWIPWEISYSLKEMTKGGKTSSTNAVLAVVLPDENRDYSYLVNHYPCVTLWNTKFLFKILEKNMFNSVKGDNLIRCSHCGDIHHLGDDHSYVFPVKWDEFIKNVDLYIEHAVFLNKNINNFNLVKQ